LKYYRYLEHVGIDEDFKAGYRSRNEFEKWMEVDPINLQREKLLNIGLSEESIQKIEKAILQQIEKSIEQAQQAPFPADSELFQNLYI
jgi:pyruvate dehydrogenase E1 component alpha subunit